MARAATTSDVFNAIAEPQRREILVLLRTGERPVTDLAQELGMTQSGASKHLRVLREVGLVRDRKAGKRRLYGLDARGLRPVHEWTGGVERVWDESFHPVGAGRGGAPAGASGSGTRASTGWTRTCGASSRNDRRSSDERDETGGAGAVGDGRPGDRDLPGDRR